MRRGRVSATVSVARPVLSPGRRAREQRQGRGEGVQEIPPADRPELPVAEEAGHRDPAEDLGHQRSAASHSDTAGSVSTSRAPPATAAATQPMSGTPPVSPATASTRAGAEARKCGEANSTANEGARPPSAARACPAARRAASPGSAVRTSAPPACNSPGYPASPGRTQAPRRCYQQARPDPGPAARSLSSGNARAGRAAMKTSSRPGSGLGGTREAGPWHMRALVGAPRDICQSSPRRGLII